jgi:MFS family permease
MSSVTQIPSTVAVKLCPGKELYPYGNTETRDESYCKESGSPESILCTNNIQSTCNEDPDHFLMRTKSETSNAFGRIASRLTTRSIVNPGPPPDRGLRAWTQVFCAWLAIMNTWGFVNSFGAFQTYFGTILPETASTISWIGSVQAWLMFFLGAFSGRALDAGLFLPTIVLGISIQVLGMFTMSLAKEYWQLFLTQGVLVGMGGGIYFCPVIGLVSTYFEKKRGMALGLATSGNAVGGVVYPLIVRQLLPQIGFQWTVRTMGFLALATMSLVIAFSKPRLPPRKQGPLIDWDAFSDLPYMLFVTGTAIMTASTYFAFYYVSIFIPVSSSSVR